MDPELIFLFTMLANVLGFTLNLIQMVGMWQVFVKANQPGWAAIIPVYANYVLTVEVARLSQLWFWLQFAPAAGMLLVLMLSCGLAGTNGIAGLVVAGIGYLLVVAAYFFIWGVTCVATAQAFRRSAGFGVGLTILPFVFFPMLGFGDDRYKRPKRKKVVEEYDEDEDDYDAEDDYDDEEDDRPRRRRSAR